ncbi:unnamed protein product, partial [Pleuronectes platessa]
SPVRLLPVFFVLAKKPTRDWRIHPADESAGERVINGGASALRCLVCLRAARCQSRDIPD